MLLFSQHELCGITLRIAIHIEYPFTLASEIMGDIGGKSGLPHSTLVVEETECPHRASYLRKNSLPIV